MDILGGINGLVGTIGGLVQGGQQLKWDKEVQKKNWELQAEQQRYDRALQQTMFQREDNAYQRKAEDLAKAGFNRLLAVGGSGSQAGPVVRSQAPQQERVEIPKFSEMAMAMMSQSADISRTVSQNRLLDIQAEKEAWNLKYWKDKKLPTDAPLLSKTVTSFVDTAKHGGTVLQQWIDEVNTKIENWIENNAPSWLKKLPRIKK